MTNFNLNNAGKACKGKTLQLIEHIHQLQGKDSANAFLLYMPVASPTFKGFFTKNCK